MKIAVASQNQVNVAGHLGRCRGFIIYSIEDNKITGKEFRENTFTHHRQHRNGEQHRGEHGQRHGHARLIEGLKDCSTIIFNAGGWRLVEELKTNGIYPFLTNEEIADRAVEKYLAGTLQESPENSCTTH